MLPLLTITASASRRRSAAGCAAVSGATAQISATGRDVAGRCGRCGGTCGWRTASHLAEAFGAAVHTADLDFVLLLALVTLGVAVHAAVRRRAVLAAVAAVAFVLFAVVWAGETFGLMDVTGTVGAVPGPSFEPARGPVGASPVVQSRHSGASPGARSVDAPVRVGRPLSQLPAAGHTAC